jgi:hypothetical protein
MHVFALDDEIPSECSFSPSFSSALAAQVGYEMRRAKSRAIMADWVFFFANR